MYITCIIVNKNNSTIINYTTNLLFSILVREDFLFVKRLSLQLLQTNVSGILFLRILAHDR